MEAEPWPGSGKDTRYLYLPVSVTTVVTIVIITIVIVTIVIVIVAVNPIAATTVVTIIFWALSRGLLFLFVRLGSSCCPSGAPGGVSGAGRDEGPLGAPRSISASASHAALDGFLSLCLCVCEFLRALSRPGKNLGRDSRNLPCGTPAPITSSLSGLEQCSVSAKSDRCPKWGVLREDRRPPV